MRRRPLATAALPVAIVMASLTAGWAPAPVAAADCTYTFPPGGGLYTGTVVDGDVLCGGPGRDRVVRMEGGVFKGRGGYDLVRVQTGGLFRGGGSHEEDHHRPRVLPYGDIVRHLIDGTFEGGAGIDGVREMSGGTFSGGHGLGYVGALSGGTYLGGDDGDLIRLMEGGTFDGGTGQDSVLDLLDGTFDGGPGEDSVVGCVESPPARYVNVEQVPSDPCPVP